MFLTITPPLASFHAPKPWRGLSHGMVASLLHVSTLLAARAHALPRYLAQQHRREAACRQPELERHRRPRPPPALPQNPPAPFAPAFAVPASAPAFSATAAAAAAAAVAVEVAAAGASLEVPAAGGRDGLRAGVTGPRASRPPPH